MTEKGTKENIERLKKALDKKGISKEVKSIVEDKIALIEKQKTVNK